MFSVVLFWTALDLHYFFCLLLFLHQIERHNNSSPHNGFRNCCVTITVFAIHLWVADDSVGWPWHQKMCHHSFFSTSPKSGRSSTPIFPLSPPHIHSNVKSDGAWKSRVLTQLKLGNYATFPLHGGRKPESLAFGLGIVNSISRTGRVGLLSQ